MKKKSQKQRRIGSVWRGEGGKKEEVRKGGGRGVRKGVREGEGELRGIEGN